MDPEQIYARQSAELMKDMGNILATDKEAFIDVLEASDIPVKSTDEYDLIDVYIDNLPSSDALKVTSAYVLGEKSSGFSGVDNKEVCANYDILYNFFDEEMSNTAGLIAGAIKESAKLGTAITKGQQQKKYGASMSAEKQADAKRQIIQAVLENKKLQEEAQKKKNEEKSKTKRYLIIGGSVIGGLALIGLVIYFIKRKK